MSCYSCLFWPHGSHLCSKKSGPIHWIQHRWTDEGLKPSQSWTKKNRQHWLTYMSVTAAGLKTYVGVIFQFFIVFFLFVFDQFARMSHGLPCPREILAVNWWGLKEILNLTRGFTRRSTKGLRGCEWFPNPPYVTLKHIITRHSSSNLLLISEA